MSSILHMTFCISRIICLWDSFVVDSDGAHVRRMYLVTMVYGTNSSSFTLVTDELLQLMWREMCSIFFVQRAYENWIATFLRF